MFSQQELYNKFIQKLIWIKETMNNDVTYLKKEVVS